MHHKKAQGISLNVIIIAAVALLVLVILSVFFMDKMPEKVIETAPIAGGCGI